MDTALRPCSALPRDGGQREQAPVQLAQLEAEERIDGETARAGERHAEASEPEHQRVLVAALHQEEALFEVRADARDQHHSEHDRGRSRPWRMSSSTTAI
jgi:hypothetical protein